MVKNKETDTNKSKGAGDTNVFEFTKENKKEADAHIKKYPKGKQESAVLPLLWIAQKQNDNWLSMEAIEYVANYLSMPMIKVLEVATFYTMFNLKPVGKHLIQVCRTASCYLRGAEGITKACKNHLGVGLDEMTKDGKFTIKEVECLGACANAPVVQINDDYFEDLSAEKMLEILKKLADGETVSPGSQIGRVGSSPGV